MYAIFIDIETTGLDPKVHKVIDIALKFVNLTTKIIEDSYYTTINLNREEWDAHDPNSLIINGYSWDMVSQGVNREIVQNEIIALFHRKSIVRGKAVFICQNPAFDRVFFAQLVDFSMQEKMLWPYHWLDLASMYWAFTVSDYEKKGICFPESFSVSKNEIAKRYSIPPEEHPHRGVNGVDHLIQCYEALFDIKFIPQSSR